MNLIYNFSSILIGITLLPITYFLGVLFLKKVDVLCFEWKGILGQVIGFGVLSYLIVFLGAMNYLRSDVFWGLYGLLLILSIVKIQEWFFWVKSLFKSFVEKGGWLERLSFVLGGVYFSVLLIGTAVPEVGSDALCYHLGTPKAFLSAGGFFYSPYDVNSIFPFFQQMLYLFGFGLKSVVLAKMIHFEMGILLFLSIFLILKRFQVVCSFFWAMLFIVTPGITNQMTTAFTDVALTLYVLLGIYFLFEGVETQKKIFYLLGGLFLGFSFSIKAIAGIYLLSSALVCFVIVFSVRGWNSEYLGRFVGGVFLALLAFVLACGFWYLRTYIVMGNPFYPYFSGVESGLEYSVGGRGISLLNFILLPWNLVVHATSFGNRGDQIGPIFSLILPFAIWAGLKIKYARYYLITTFVAVLLWFFIGERSRFLYPILPFCFISGVLGFALFQKSFPRAEKVLVVLFFTILLGGVVLSVYHYRDQMKVFIGAESRQDFRQNSERSKVITDYINQQLPQNVKILNAEEIHRFYFERPIVREGLFAKETRYYENYKTPAEVVNFLRDNGFTHVLISMPKGAERDLAELRVGAIIQDKKNAERYFYKIFESDSLNKKDQKYHYILYRIQ